MKSLSILWLVLLYGGCLVAAQDAFALMKEMPTCATSCILKYLPSSGCALTDIRCLCDNQSLWASTLPCLQNNCTTRDQLNATKLSRETCGAPLRDNSLQLYVVGPTLTGVSLIFLILRLISRQQVISGKFGPDDGLIIAAWITGLPVTVLHIYLAKEGLGKDVWRVPFDNITKMLMWFFASEPPYLFSTVVTRMSILAFFLRIFPAREFRIRVFIVMAINTAFSIGILFPLIFQCSPISYAWTRWDNQQHGKCINVNAGIWSHAAINIVLDLVVLILPLPQLIRLQMSFSFRRKIHILIMFSFGIIVTVISSLRLRSLVVVAKSINPTWDYLGSAIWSVIEIHTGIICACLPAVKVFIAHLFEPPSNDTTFASSTASPTKESFRTSPRNRTVDSAIATDSKLGESEVTELKEVSVRSNITGCISDSSTLISKAGS